MGNPNCCYRGCTNRADKQNCSYFRFPFKEQNRRRAWIKNSGNPSFAKLPPADLIRKHLCEYHFSENDIIAGTMKKSLLRTAVPKQCENLGRKTALKNPKNRRRRLMEQAKKKLQKRLEINKTVGEAVGEAVGEDIEVDPELFNLCRLCIESKGRFLLTPALIEQVDFCYGITIKANDGLPQLLCEQCKMKLKDYYSDKKNYIEKQETLNNRKYNPKHRQVQSVPPNQRDTSSNPYIVSEKTNSLDQTNYTKAVEIVQSTGLIKSSSRDSKDSKQYVGNELGNNLIAVKDNVATIELNIDKSQLDAVAQSSNGKPTTKNYSSKQKDKMSLIRETLTLNGYKDVYCCKMCNTKASLYSIKRHVKKTHHTLEKTRKRLTPKECNVSLNRIDDKMNIAGTLSCVVMRPGKIVSINTEESYLKIYELFDEIESESEYEDDSETTISTQTQYVESESDNDDELPLKRLKSEENNDLLMPTETKNSLQIAVDSELNSNSEPISDETLPDETLPAQDLASAKENGHHEESNQRTVKLLVQSTLTKLRQSENEGPSSKPPDALNKKMLNVGVRTMHKKGINSVGVLQYLEKRHLEVTWIDSRGNSDDQSEPWQVRIHSEIIKSNDIPQSFVAFKVLKEKNNVSETTLIEPLRTNCAANTQSNDGECDFRDLTLAHLLNKSPAQFPKPSKRKPYNMPSTSQNLPQETAVNSATINLDSDDDESFDLQKSQTNDEIQDNELYFNAIFDNEHIPINKENVTEGSALLSSDELVDSTMPIITSTTSLAGKRPVVIKCKPTSQLLKSSVMNSNPANDMPSLASPINSIPTFDMPTPSNIITPTPFVGDFVILSNILTTTPSNIVITTPSNIVTTTPSNIVTTTPSNIDGYSLPPSIEDFPSANGSSVPMLTETGEGRIMLHSVTSPNVLTPSPFRYVAEVLSIHSIQFQLSTALWLTSLQCVARYKLSVSQEPLTKMLHLEIFISPGIVYFRVRSHSDPTFNVTELAANWQWEIIKSVQSTSIREKILKSSSIIGCEFFETASKFVALIADIEEKKTRK